MDLGFSEKFPRVIRVKSYTPPEVSQALLSLDVKSMTVFDLSLKELAGPCGSPCEICEEKLELSRTFNQGHFPAFAVRGAKKEKVLRLPIYHESQGSSPDSRHLYKKR
jgi:hypothetical protein